MTAAFSARLGLVSFSSNQPGNHVTLFGPDGGRCSFRGDLSSFDDAGRSYAWVFEYVPPLVDGALFVFATADRAVVGVTRGGAIEVASASAAVLREPNGKPYALARKGEGGSSAMAPAPAAPPAPAAVNAPGRPISLGLFPKNGVPPPERGLRCLFINPSVPYNQWSCYRAGVMNEASFSSHGMAYVSATLKAQGHTCWLVDLRSHNGWAHVAETFRQEVYDVAFVGFLSIDAFNAAAVVRLLKEIHPDRPVVVGGLHVSIAKERVFPRPDLISYYCWDNYDIVPHVFQEFLRWKGEDRFDSNRFPLADYVILDDGEIAARDLVAELAAGRRPAERTLEGGAVPMEVARHLDRDLFRLDFEAYSPILPFQPTPMVTVTWARGCPWHCRYCNLASQLSNTNVRHKPIELIEEELDDLHRRFGGRVGSIMVHDDLTFHPKHIAAWCELIIRKYNGIPLWLQTRSDWIVTRYRREPEVWNLLCRAGLTWVSVGFESGVQRVLDFMQKDNTVEHNIEAAAILSEFGLNAFANLLWGCPTESNEEAEQTVAFVQRIRPGFLSGSVYCNYPGVQLDAWCRENNYLMPGEVYTRSHLPWQIRIKGIDYPHVFNCVQRAGQFSNYLRMPKMIPEDRQRELSAFSRGLPIHAAGRD